MDELYITDQEKSITNALWQLKSERLDQEYQRLSQRLTENRKVGDTVDMQELQETLQKLDEFFLHPEEGEDALGAGIKGITEDTANLLASYINAMRSDVSQMRAIQEHHLPIISAAMPTIMDHLAQIQANTFDTAVNTSSMLARLVSIDDRIGTVIDTGNNGDAIKVLM